MAEHWRCLEEVATGIGYSLSKLGHAVEYSFGRAPDFTSGGRFIIFNAHVLLPVLATGLPLPPDAIIYNAEQVPDGPIPTNQMWWFPYLALLRNRQVWDYSETNIERFRRRGVNNVKHCRVGWYPNSGSCVEATFNDVSVLFVGSLNPRRAELIDRLHGLGIDVKHLFGLYGYQRDHWIARSKIVLNVHFYDKPIFEIFRVSHLLASKKCVVSEGGGCDSELEAFAANATKLVSYDEIPEACVRLLEVDEERKFWARTGYERFRQIDQVAEVERALREQS